MMSATFEVGQRVRCIHTRRWTGADGAPLATAPRQGRLCTIRAVTVARFGDGALGLGLAFEEIGGDGRDHAFDSRGFEALGEFEFQRLAALARTPSLSAREARGIGET